MIYIFWLFIAVVVMVILVVETKRLLPKMISFAGLCTLIIWLWMVITTPFPKPIDTIYFQIYNKTAPSGQISQYYVEDGVEKDSPYKDVHWDTETCYIVKRHIKGYLCGVYVDFISYDVKQKENEDDSQ